MRRLFLCGILLLAGCQNVVGPLDPRPPARVDDPVLGIGEQKHRGRAYLPLPEESPLIAPPSGAAWPGSTFQRQ